ncbi:MAG: hypothetical protein U0R19_39065 [Bryobacteraceae bacterium]
MESLLDFRRMEGPGMDASDACAGRGGSGWRCGGGFPQELAGRDAIRCDTLRAQVEGDAEALGRALWNLLDNAVKCRAGPRGLKWGWCAGTGMCV